MSTPSEKIQTPAAANLENWTNREWTDGVQIDQMPDLGSPLVQIRNSSKGYSLRSTTTYGLWSGWPGGVGAASGGKSASVWTWEVRTACVMSR